MKKLLKKIWNGVKAFYEKIVWKTRAYVPIAIKIVEGIKKVIDSPVDDIVLSIVATAIPGEADDKIIKKVKEIVENWVPKILIELRIVNSIAGIEDPNEQLKAILTELQKLDPKSQSAVWHNLAVMIIEKLSDGELSWSDSVFIAEYAYQVLILKKEGK